MKKIFTLVLLLLSQISSAQNYVPNFSFEQYHTCPDSEDQIDRATGWSKYSITNTTPDYFNACAPAGPGGYNVPFCSNEYQADHRNCGAYGGLATFSLNINGYREHIGIRMSQALTIGQKYYISFVTVMGQAVTTNGVYLECRQIILVPGFLQLNMTIIVLHLLTISHTFIQQP